MIKKLWYSKIDDGNSFILVVNDQVFQLEPDGTYIVLNKNPPRIKSYIFESDIYSAVENMRAINLDDKLMDFMDQLYSAVEKCVSISSYGF